MPTGIFRGKRVVIDRAHPREYEAPLRSTGAIFIGCAGSTRPLDPLRVLTPTTASHTTKGN